MVGTQIFSSAIKGHAASSDTPQVRMKQSNSKAQIGSPIPKREVYAKHVTLRALLENRNLTPNQPH